MTNRKKALKFFEQNPGHLKTSTVDLAERLHINELDVTNARRDYRSNYIATGPDVADFSQQAEKKSVKTQYQEFLKKHGIPEDTVSNVYFKEKKEGVRFTVQQYPNKDKEDFNLLEAIVDHLKEYEDTQVFVPNLPKVSEGSSKIALINIFDAHLDKISFLSETDEHNTLESNMQRFEDVFDELLYGVTEKNPELILFPISGDLFQTNDENLTTKKGTDQKHQQNTDPKGAYKKILSLVRRCIDKCKRVCHTKVLPLKGNHDEDKMFYLAATIEVAYERDENVTVVDCSRKQRVYERYGRWLFGFAHGDKEKSKVKELPSLMSTDKDSKKYWSDVEQGVFFLGDIHHEREYDFLRTQDFRGCKIKFLRGATGTDKWHTDHGWTGVPKTAYADIYNKNSGRVYYIAIDM